jgi:hypothetical protein
MIRLSSDGQDSIKRRAQLVRFEISAVAAAIKTVAGLSIGMRGSAGRILAS